MSVAEESARGRRAAVYRLYDADGSLLYIGSAYDPEKRCKKHRKQPWWPQVVRRADEWFEHRNFAYEAETKAIATEHPKHNVAGTPGYTPDSNAIRRRNKLNPLRQKLVRQANQAGFKVYDTLRKQGVGYADARMAGDEAIIDFLEKTGLFTDAVKRRRAALDDPGHRATLRTLAKTFGEDPATARQEELAVRAASLPGATATGGPHIGEVLRRAALLFQAVEYAEGLGWSQIGVDRLLRVARGDDSALPPDPATAPRSAFGSRPTPFRPAKKDPGAPAS